MTAAPNNPWPADTRYLQTGNLRVDLRYRRITCAGREVELQQRLFDLLLLLLAEPHVLHSRTALFERLWPGVIVEDANLSQSMWLLRKALGEEGKHWIRTIAKGGYVFEPPGPVDAFAQLPSTAIEMPALPAQPSSRADRTLPWHRWSIRAAAACFIAAIAVGLIWQRDATPKAIPVASLPSLSLILIDVEDRNARTRWPVKLLHQWLGWKLGSLPEVTLMTEADFAVHNGSSAPQVVFLSAAAAPGEPGQLLLRARFQQAGREQRLELKGPASQVPAMVDGLSRRLMTRLLPRRAEPWPALVLDAPAARRYADAVDAIERRDSMAAATALGDVVKLAPSFGLARMQLAHAQARLAQASAAIEQMDLARQLLQPAPLEVTELLDAQRLAIDPEFNQQAAEAFARLAARYPDKADYTLEYARQLLGAKQPQQALKLLSRPGWDRQPMGTRFAHRIALSQIHEALGDPERMRQNAQAAERVATDAGDGWELELAKARLQLAIADTMQYQERAGTQGYEVAAKYAEMAGNHTLALFARFLAETTAPPTSGPNPRLEALLVEARKGGYRSLEIEILSRAADQYHSVGDLIAYRRRLEEALAAARIAGNVQVLNQLSMALLAEDIQGGRFDHADAHLRRLRPLNFQGKSGVVLGELDASLDALRGHYARSIRTLDHADRALAALQPTTGPTQPQAELACGRANARLQLGDLVGARTELQRCTASEDPSTQLDVLMGRARTELLAGDRAAAENLLRRVQTIVPTLHDGPGRWEHTINLSTLLTRIGDTAESDRLYAMVLPRLRSVEYQWQIANAQTGLAENAAARGDWDESQQHVDAARQGLPPDAWPLVYRLDILDLAAALTLGDRPHATAIAARVHGKAHRMDDKVAQLEIHNLLPPDFIADDCSQARRDSLVASTGLRGAMLDWISALHIDPVARLALDGKLR